MAVSYPNYRVFGDEKNINIHWKTNRLALPGGRSYRKDTFQKTLDNLTGMPEEFIPKQIVQPSVNLGNKPKLTKEDRFALAYLQRKEEHEAKKKYADVLVTQNSSGNKPFAMPQSVAIDPKPPGGGGGGGGDVQFNFRPAAGSAPTSTGGIAGTVNSVPNPLVSHVAEARIQNINEPQFPMVPTTRRASDHELEMRLRLLNLPMTPQTFERPRTRAKTPPPRSPKHFSPPSSPSNPFLQATYGNTVAVPSSHPTTPPMDAIVPDSVQTHQAAGSAMDVDDNFVEAFENMQIDDRRSTAAIQQSPHAADTGSISFACNQQQRIFETKVWRSKKGSNR